MKKKIIVLTVWIKKGEKDIIIFNPMDDPKMVKKLFAEMLALLFKNRNADTAWHRIDFINNIIIDVYQDN